MADRLDAIKRLACAEKAHGSGSSTGLSTTSNYQLPLDFVERAAVRLGWVSAIYALFFFVIYVVHRLTPTGKSLSPDLLIFYTVTSAAGVILGAGMSAFAFTSNVSPYRKLDVGLIFQILGALVISISESRYPIAPGEFIRGHSSIAIWLVFFILLVPTCRLRTVVAATLTALMGPLGLWLNMRWFGIPSPTAEQWIFLNLGTVLAAVVSIPLSRVVYNLGAQVSKAREMGSYDMIDLIGKGGMGEVWRARHRLLARQAAIKLIKPEALFGTEAAQSDAARRRFEREAQAIASLQSPNTVTLFDYGVNGDGVFYYAMELLDGIDLDTLIRRYGPVPAERAVFVLRQICDSLAEAHARGITHRDVKPKNIILCRLGLNYDFVKVLDFGLAKYNGSTAETQLTREGVTTGTPAFMAPEMALGSADVDARADIYAIGCVAYWLVTGKLVFEAPTPMAMALAHVRNQPVPPSERTEMEIPRELEHLILRCLAKDPESRPASARAISRELSQIAFPRVWDSPQAEEWWQIHRPSPCPQPEFTGEYQSASSQDQATFAAGRTL